MYSPSSIMANHWATLLVGAVLTLAAPCRMDADDPDKFGDQNAATATPEGNPIIPGLFADPSLAKFGDTFYLYTTTDGFGWETGRWVTWQSKDFVHWSFAGESFPEITGQKNWAPGKPIFQRGKYWLPFTWKGDGNYLAVADQPGGPWHFTNNQRPLSPSIDPELFVDDNGTTYLISGAGKPGIWRMKPDLSGVSEKLCDLDFHKGYIEGAFLFKRHSVYYACAANLGYAEYRLIYMTSDKLSGPWHSPDNNFIIQPAPSDHLWGTGHGNVLQLPGTDQWILIYLRSRMGEVVDPFRTGNVYRQVCAERLSFQPDGTIQEAKPSRLGVGLLTTSANPGRNLAAGKAASASSARTGYGPEKAVDESFGTRWIAATEDQVVPTAEVQAETWRWTTEPPNQSWLKPGFDASAWPEGKGGFGTADTPGAIIGTTWKTADIWARREFTLTENDLKRDLQLRLFHDEDAQVYLNGVLATTRDGFTSKYEQVPIDAAARAGLHSGTNVMAVHCHNTVAGQFIDAGLTAAALAPWWQVDLGAVVPVGHTEISFNYPTEITPYTLLWSRDGKDWKVYADHREDQVHASPKVDRQAVQAQYLRVQFSALETQQIPAGLWEFKAFEK